MVSAACGRPGFTTVWLTELLCCSIMMTLTLATSGKGKGAYSKGTHGYSGQRCVICQALAAEAQQTWVAAKHSKTGSPYHYIGLEEKGTTPEEIVVARVKSAVCNRQRLKTLPNPNNYALHMPTISYECENLMEEQVEGMVDALGLGENLSSFCWENGICGGRDELLFEFAVSGQGNSEL
mmetsp:Transcript_22137/g.40704  ORF Transcript_22137/g.40704 Transcript_22137/m.40704 type:complete len:180 (-) Transcript_22137:84-623(-)